MSINAKINTPAITGDAAARNATIVPSLNAASDPLIKVINSYDLPEQGHIYMNEFTNNAFINCFPQSYTLNNIVFDFVSNSPVRLNDIVLQMSMLVTVTPTATEALSSPQSKNVYDFANGIQQQMAWLQFINTIQVTAGDNNVIIGSPPMLQTTNGNPISLTSSLESNYSGLSEKLKLELTAGLPYSVGISKEVTATSFYLNSNPPNPEWEALYRKYMTEIYNVIWNSQTTAPAAGVPISAVIPICIPFRKLHMHFANDSFVPAGVHFKMSIVLNTQNFNVSDTGACVMSASLQQNQSSIHKLCYMSYIMNAASQLQFNNSFMSTPITYLANDVSYYDQQPQSQANFITTFNISSQQPRQIYFALYNSSGTTQTITTTTMPNAITITNLPDALACGYYIKNVKLTIGGRNQIFYQPDYIAENIRTQSDYLNDGLNYLAKFNQLYTERKGYEDRAIRSQFNMFTYGGYFIINVDPSMENSLGKTTSDPGACTMTLECEIRDINGNPMTNNYKLRVYKIVDTQWQLNAAHQVTTIKWPAIATLNGTPAISSTFNQQQ